MKDIKDLSDFILKQQEEDHKQNKSNGSYISTLQPDDLEQWLDIISTANFDKEDEKVVNEILGNCKEFLDDIKRNMPSFADSSKAASLSTKVYACQIQITDFRLKKALADTERKLDEKLDHTTDSTLTIMGIFATIITVILSVVVTSSSWLNNADGASAVLAFVVPSLVAVSAAVAMLGIVLADRDKRSKVVRNTGITVAVVAVLSLVIWFCIAQMDANLLHTRYILAPGMYQVETVDTDGKERVIKFEIEAGKYMIPYKRDYFHEGETLYFCMQHKKLE